MSFTDHKISQFVHRVVDLPDQPNLPSDELKARFDSSPEELRVAHNALCDDADRLDDRVSGIIAETFGDTITKSMLSDELADEIDAKATKAELDEDTAALDTRLDTVETALPTKCEIYVGSYVGNGTPGGNNSQLISLSFAPRAVIVFNSGGLIDNSGYRYGGVASAITLNSTAVRLEGNGFRVYSQEYQSELNHEGYTYGYIAIK